MKNFKLFLEAYSNRLIYLRDYLKNKEIDPYAVWYLFPDFVEYEGLNYNSDDPEFYYSLSKSVQDNFKEYITNRTQKNSIEVPWLYMDLTSNELLSNKTWLIHFSDDAYKIAQKGFTHGTYDIERLAYTTHYSQTSKRHGGFNFAFDTESGHRNINEKYGKEAVMFQSAGIEVIHYGDEEYQVIFDGQTVNPKDIVYLHKYEGSWVVGEHPNAKKKVKQDRPIYIGDEKNGDLQDVIKWVINNVNQYKHIITGR